MMAPVGLTTKKVSDKYNQNTSGELMLVHYCIDCGAFSINRIAADDDNLKLIATFKNNLLNKTSFMHREKLKDIEFLGEEDRQMLQSGLFGSTCVTRPEHVCA
jgi:hypothetical protein